MSELHKSYFLYIAEYLSSLCYIPGWDMTEKYRFPFLMTSCILLPVNHNSYTQSRNSLARYKQLQSSIHIQNSQFVSYRSFHSRLKYNKHEQHGIWSWLFRVEATRFCRVPAWKLAHLRYYYFCYWICALFARLFVMLLFVWLTAPLVSPVSNLLCRTVYTTCNKSALRMQFFFPCLCVVLLSSPIS